MENRIGKIHKHSLNLGCALALASVLVASHSPAMAQSTSSSQFDKPTAIRKVPKKSDSESQEASCTYFSDFMIRDLSDGPTAEAPVIVRGTGAPCTIKPYPRGQSLDLSDMNFLGRKGAYLFFLSTDGHGTTGFSIVHASNGKVILNDRVYGNAQFTGMSVGTDGSLAFKFTRGVVAECSLMENARACWSKLVAGGNISKELVPNPPSSDICGASYRRDKATKDIPSIVTYPTEINLSKEGNRKIISNGKIGCQPHP